MTWYRTVGMLSVLWLAVSSAAPARRYPGDLEARRRSAVDRSMIRLGRSWPPPVTSSDIREYLSQGFGKNNAQVIDLDLQNPQLRQALLHLENYNRLGRLNLEDLQDSPFKRQQFVRFGRPYDSDDLVHLIKSYNDEYDSPSKRAMDFIRLGRDTKFIRFGKSEPERPNESDETDVKWIGDKQLRIARARNHFLRLGRDAEELNEADEHETADDRKKRSPTATADCHDC